MRRFLLGLLLLVLAPSALLAQEALTAKQRIADLEQLASFYAKNYAPYEWKRDVIGFDLLRLTPWLQRIQHVMHRGRLIQTPDLPAAPYVENIGVRPDIVIDYMTRTNLMTAGAPFVQAFTQVIVDHATP